MTNEREGWSEPEVAEFRELKVVGREPEEGAGGVVWRNLLDAHWYDGLRALAIVKGDEDPAD